MKTFVGTCVETQKYDDFRSRTHRNPHFLGGYHLNLRPPSVIDLTAYLQYSSQPYGKNLNSAHCWRFGNCNVNNLYKISTDIYINSLSISFISTILKILLRYLHKLFRFVMITLSTAFGKTHLIKNGLVVTKIMRPEKRVYFVKTLKLRNKIT